LIFPLWSTRLWTNYSVAIRYLHSNKIAGSMLYFWMYLGDLPGCALLVGPAQPVFFTKSE
jgi:hypothetical protein